MTSLLLPLLLFSATAEEIATRREAVAVYHCDFESASDKNFDGWPDEWTRRSGSGYPAYLPLEICADSSGPRPTPGHCFRFELDGGGAVAYSPPIEIVPLYSYVLQIHLRTEQLRHTAAHCAITFLDNDRQVLETVTSPHYRQAERWTKITLGPATPSRAEARWAIIELHLEPGSAADLVGAACFDDLWFGRLPRVTVSTSSEYNIFTDPEEVEITCRVSGIADADPHIRFDLMDIDGQVAASVELPVHPDLDSAAARESQRSRSVPGLASRREVPFSGTTTWQPPLPGNGFYRIRASIPNHAGLMIERTINVAVVDPLPKKTQGEFGWSLPQGEEPLPLRTLSALLDQVGVHWAKFPVWYGDQDEGRSDRLAWFAERLGASHIELVGLLDDPPPEVRAIFGDRRNLPVASVFLEPEVWHPAVDPVMTRLSLKVRWWQLGGDRDTSFVNFPDLEGTLRDIRRDLSRFGQEIKIGVAWRTIDEPPTVEKPPWSFLSYKSDPPLAPHEIRAYFPQHRSHPGERWLLLEPLSKQDYDLHTRAKDLALRMLVARIENIEGIFIPDPFHPDHGLMEPNGTPNELLLAWRTTSAMISGARYLGSLQLPNGSQNHVFLRGGDAVMMIWNDEPTEESLYLGEHVRQVDLWGRSATPQHVRQDEAVNQVIQAGPLPTFVTGLNPVIAQWRMGFEFETQRLASVFGQAQTATYHFRNVFPQGVGGSVSLHTPIVSDGMNLESKFKLAAGEQHRETMHLVLGSDVNSGPQLVRADFTIIADHTYRFSVYRTIEVGLGDVEVEMTSRLDEQGNLVVEQHLVNKTDGFVNFRCLLFAEGRRRQSRQVYNLGRGRSTNVFIFPDGKELVGTTLWLRAEEIGGARVLNHHGTAAE